MVNFDRVTQQIKKVDVFGIYKFCTALYDRHTHFKALVSRICKNTQVGLLIFTYSSLRYRPIQFSCFKL